MLSTKVKVFNLAYLLLVAMILGWIYFRSLISSLVIFLILILTQYILPKTIKKRNDDLLAFKMLLDGIYTELIIGRSFRNALIESRKHMTLEKKSFLIEVDQLIRDIRLQNRELLAWENFSKKMDLEPCKRFVEVLSVTYEYGGQVTKVLKHTIKGLTDQMDLDLEIEIILSSKGYEFYLMIAIPILLLLLLSYSQYTYMAVLYETTMGRFVMSFGLFIQIVAYLIGRKIIEIEV